MHRWRENFDSLNIEPVILVSVFFKLYIAEFGILQLLSFMINRIYGFFRLTMQNSEYVLHTGIENIYEIYV